MENKINANMPVIGNDNGKLNDVNAITPAVGAENAENQPHIEQAAATSELQANGVHEMPNAEMQAREVGIGTEQYDLPNMSFDKLFDIICDDKIECDKKASVLAEMKPIKAARLLNAFDPVQIANIVAKMNCDVAANILIRMDRPKSIGAFYFMDNGVAEKIITKAEAIAKNCYVIIKHNRNKGTVIIDNDREQQEIALKKIEDFNCFYRFERETAFIIANGEYRKNLNVVAELYRQTPADAASQLAKMDSDEAVDIVNNMHFDRAGGILSEMEVVSAANILFSILKESRRNASYVISNMKVDSAARVISAMSKQDIDSVVRILASGFIKDDRLADILSNMENDHVVSIFDALCNFVDDFSISKNYHYYTANIARLISNMDQAKAAYVLRTLRTIKHNRVLVIFTQMDAVVLAGILDQMTKQGQAVVAAKILDKMDTELARKIFCEMSPKVSASLIDEMHAINEIAHKNSTSSAMNNVGIEDNTKTQTILAMMSENTAAGIFCEMRTELSAELLCAISTQKLIKTVCIICAMSKKDSYKTANILTEIAKTNIKVANDIFLNMGSMYAANILSEMEPEVAAKVILAKGPNTISEILGLMASAKAAALRQEIEKAQSK